jgi:undecaprenyl-diphosphatase
LVAVAVPLYAGGACAAEWGTPGLAWDAAVRDVIDGLGLPDHPPVLQAISLLSHTGTVAVGQVLLVLRLAATDRRDDARFVATAASGPWLLHPLTKALVDRRRPHGQDQRLGTTSSYPSGHAMATTSLVSAGVVLAWRTRWRWLVLMLGTLWVLLASAMRVARDAHHPSDVLAGSLAAGVWVWGVRGIVWGQRAATASPREGGPPGACLGRCRPRHRHALRRR